MGLSPAASLSLAVSGRMEDGKAAEEATSFILAHAFQPTSSSTLIQIYVRRN